MSELVFMFDEKKIIFDENGELVFPQENKVLSQTKLIFETDTNTQSEENSLFFSWNVNIYSEDVHKFLTQYINKYCPAVIFLSETKKQEDVLQKYFTEFKDYNYIINAHKPAKFHGVAFLIHKDYTFDRMNTKMNIKCRQDSVGNCASVGRVIAFSLSKKSWNNKFLYIVGSYTPNSGQRDQVKLDYRVKDWDLEFKKCFLDYFVEHGIQSSVIWLGDINVALDEIDVSHVSKMKSYAGFTSQERQNFRNILEEKDEKGECRWVDIWRSQHKNKSGFTWRGRNGDPNYGMRLDNIIISNELVKNVVDSEIVNEKAESADHVPVTVTLNF
jgi:exodeoxyribonuclease III